MSWWEAPLRPVLKRLQRLAAFLADSRGGIAVTFALAAPVVAVIACGAVDLASVSSDRSNMQDVADATALQAAGQLGLSDPNGIAARNEAFALYQLKDQALRTTFTVKTDIVRDEGKVTVTINGVRQSFFMNMMPPGGWKLAARSTASTLASRPLCVLSTGQDKLSSIVMKDQALLSAPDCMVQSNEDINVSNNAWLKAALTQSAGLAAGNILPAPQVGGLVIPDPFTSLPIATSDPCGILSTVVENLLEPGTHTLYPGVHCGVFKVEKDTTLVLAPGEHYFLKGGIDIKGNGILSGDDVVLVFDKDGKFGFHDTAQIKLSGRRSGSLAGFVIATTPKNDKTFEIDSDSARQLLGTIYIPGARLKITGGQNKVADQSAWTVIVAKAIEMSGAPNLVVNANYAGSVVPVPAGVGPSTGVHLLK